MRLTASDRRLLTRKLAVSLTRNDQLNVTQSLSICLVTRQITLVCLLFASHLRPMLLGYR